MNAMQGMDRYQKEVIQVSTFKEWNISSVYRYNTNTNIKGKFQGITV